MHVYYNAVYVHTYKCACNPKHYENIKTCMLSVMEITYCMEWQSIPPHQIRHNALL